ncbi:hypothetical protein FQZ97_892770 [compost metagenome]
MILEIAVCSHKLRFGKTLFQIGNQLLWIVAHQNGTDPLPAFGYQNSTEGGLSDGKADGFVFTAGLVSLRLHAEDFVRSLIETAGRIIACLVDRVRYATVIGFEGCAHFSCTMCIGIGLRRQTSKAFKDAMEMCWAGTSNACNLLKCRNFISIFDEAAGGGNHIRVTRSILCLQRCIDMRLAPHARAKASVLRIVASDKKLNIFAFTTARWARRTAKNARRAYSVNEFAI